MFRLAKLSLRNRAVVALVTLAIIVGGAFSLGSLKQELIPSLELPMAGVITVYPGASAAIVEDQVVEPVEGAIRGVAGVDSVDTTSMDSVAISLVTFRYGTNMDTANQKLSTAVTRLGGSLPDDVETNVIVGSLDDFPIVSLAVSGDDGAAADATSLAQAVDAVLVPDLSKLAGVRTVDVSGYEPEVVEIELDTPAMAAAGVSATAVMDVLKNNGLAFPAGTVTEGDESLTAQIGQPLTSVDELAGLPLIAQAPSAAGAAGAGDAGAAAAAAGAGAGGAVGGDAAADADGAGAANAAGAAGSAGAGTAGGGGGNGAGTAGAAGGDAAGGAGAAGAAGGDAAAAGTGSADAGSVDGAPTEAPASAAAIPGPVLLSDVATITQGPASSTSYSRMDGHEAVAISITKTPDANTVEVSHAVRDAVDDLADVLESRGLHADIAFDQAPFIEESVRGLTTEGLLGLGFAVLVILAFLVSIRSTLVSAISIPLSLLVAFIAMRATGETLNMLTLGALTMAVGRVVDDSIVVIENIKRHLSYGEEKREAILGAVKEVGGAIAASTVCMVAVFAPIMFVGGMVGELFRPFGLTTTIALLASLAVALTIVPVLAYWFVPSPVSVDAADQAHQRAEAEAKERRGLWQRAYLPTLRGALAHPVITLVIAVVLLGGTAAMVPRLETNFLGGMGQDTLTVTETFEPGTSLEAQDRDAREVEAALGGLDEVGSVQTTVGSGGGDMALVSGSEPTATFSITLADGANSDDAEARVRDAVSGLGGPRSTGISVGGMEAMMGSMSAIDLVVTGSDVTDVNTAARAVEERVAGVPGAVEVATDLGVDTPAIQVTVDRLAAAALGMSETQVEGTVAGLMRPTTIGTLDTADGRVDVQLSMGASVDSLEGLRALPLGAGPAGVLTLDDVASVEEVMVPAALTRVDGRRSATVSVTPESQDLGALSGRLEAAVDELDLPAGVTVEVGGATAMQNEAFSDMGLALVLAIAIVFIVMVATFGSLLQPFVLLISIPFAATGALAALLVSGTPLGVPALIGALMLVGIVVSNAIVLIDLINQYRRRGRALDEAIVEGARKRLRPIVMTAVATVLALTPMALGITGEGAFISKPLAIVVIGGLVASTLLTLIVVPVLYRFEARAHDRREARREARLDARRAERMAARIGAGAGGGETQPEAPAPSA